MDDFEHIFLPCQKFGNHMGEGVARLAGYAEGRSAGTEGSPSLSRLPQAVIDRLSFGAQEMFGRNRGGHPEREKRELKEAAGGKSGERRGRRMVGTKERGRRYQTT